MEAGSHNFITTQDDVFRYFPFSRQGDEDALGLISANFGYSVFRDHPSIDFVISGWYG